MDNLKTINATFDLMEEQEEAYRAEVDALFVEHGHKPPFATNQPKSLEATS